MTAVTNRHSYNLPSWPNSLIGREREMAEVKRLMASTRLLTLTGPGGCGKTRLAGATADRLAASPLFEHGSWFIDLAGLSDPLAVPQTIAQVLSIPEAHDRQIINSSPIFCGTNGACSSSTIASICCRPALIWRRLYWMPTRICTFWRRAASR